MMRFWGDFALLAMLAQLLHNHHDPPRSNPFVASKYSVVNAGLPRGQQVAGFAWDEQGSPGLKSPKGHVWMMRKAS